MKYLILMRHAKTKQAGHQESDFDRALLPIGLEQCEHQGKKLKRLLPTPPNKFLVSPAVRTQQTFKEVLKWTGWKSDNVSQPRGLYMASAESLIHHLREIESVDSVMLIGHNFGVADLFTYLSGKSISKYKTGTFSFFQLNISNWSELSAKDAKLLTLESPF